MSDQKKVDTSDSSVAGGGRYWVSAVDVGKVVATVSSVRGTLRAVTSDVALIELADGSYQSHPRQGVKLATEEPHQVQAGPDSLEPHQSVCVPSEIWGRALRALHHGADLSALIAAHGDYDLADFCQGASALLADIERCELAVTAGPALLSEAELRAALGSYADGELNIEETVKFLRAAVRR